MNGHAACELVILSLEEAYLASVFGDLKSPTVAATESLSPNILTFRKSVCNKQMVSGATGPFHLERFPASVSGALVCSSDVSTQRES